MGSMSTGVATSLSGASATLLSWLLSLKGITLPPDVEASLIVILATLGHYVVTKVPTKKETDDVKVG